MSGQLALVPFPWASGAEPAPALEASLACGFGDDSFRVELADGGQHNVGRVDGDRHRRPMTLTWAAWSPAMARASHRLSGPPVTNRCTRTSTNQEGSSGSNSTACSSRPWSTSQHKAKPRVLGSVARVRTSAPATSGPMSPLGPGPGCAAQGPATPEPPSPVRPRLCRSRPRSHASTSPPGGTHRGHRSAIGEVAVAVAHFQLGATPTSSANLSERCRAGAPRPATARSGRGAWPGRRGNPPRRSGRRRGSGFGPGPPDDLIQGAGL